MIQEIINNGGGTYHPRSLVTRGYTKGYMVAAESAEVIIDLDSFTMKDIKRYVKKNLIKGYDLGIGVNKENGKVYLDSSQLIMDYHLAVILARANKQIAIYNVEENRDIVIGGEACNH